MFKIWPMGCKKVTDDEMLERLILNPNYAAQRKIDGVRVIMHIDPEGLVRYTTRGASVDAPSCPIEITHRLHHLPKFLPQFSDSIFDGEMYSPKLTSSEVAGMINFRSTTEVDTSINLNIFDVIRTHGRTVISFSWSARMGVLNNFKDELTKASFIVVPYVECSDCKRQLLHEEFEAGREGVVFKNVNATYVVGSTDCKKPANNWYKYKKKDTVDVYITGSEPPEQFYRDPDTRVIDLLRTTKPWDNGWFGSITFKSIGGTFSGACSGLSDDMKQLLSDGQHNIKAEYIGRCMEVEYMEKTTDGNLRHPRFVRIREEIEK